MNLRSPIKVIATDLDGTLIPTDAEARGQMAALGETLRSQQLRLIFVTGRHYSSAIAATAEFGLPLPECIICDVGTSIYTRRDTTSTGCEVDGKAFEIVPQYHLALCEITGGRRPNDAGPGLAALSSKHPAWRMRPQEPEKQAAYKQSYYCDQSALSIAAASIRGYLDKKQLPFSVVHSVDPFTSDGLIDILPSGVAKGFALKWWVHAEQLELENVIYSGDSGNDTAAFCTGVNSTIVGNASPELVAEVRKLHPRPTNVYHSPLPSTAAVLDGIRHFTHSTTAP
jgi:hydroxymethylpyrimidine pyrophosphatase-like HAD family hydrolase